MVYHVHIIICNLYTYVCLALFCLCLGGASVWSWGQLCVVLQSVGDRPGLVGEVLGHVSCFVGLGWRVVCGSGVGLLPGAYYPFLAYLLSIDHKAPARHR